MKVNDVVIGKRVTIGAAINSLAAVFAAIYPQHSVPIVAAAVPVTFLIQVWVANRYGITQ